MTQDRFRQDAYHPQTATVTALTPPGIVLGGGQAGDAGVPGLAA